MPEAQLEPEQTTELVETITTAPHADMRSIWGGDVQTYLTYDGRQCSYSLKMLTSVLGGAFAQAHTSEQAAFLAYCINCRLDPIRKQVHFIRYKPTEPASFVTNWEVFLDRAQRHPQFDGYENGIIWRVKQDDGNWEMIRSGPCDYFPDATHEIAGGWATVHRKDRGHPRTVEVPLGEMQGTNRDGQPVRNWRTQPTTMCVKTPTSRALRQSFPEDLSNMYTEGEVDAFQDALRSSERALESGDTIPPTDLDEIADRLETENTDAGEN